MATSLALLAWDRDTTFLSPMHAWIGRLMMVIMEYEYEFEFGDHKWYKSRNNLPTLQNDLNNTKSATIYIQIEGKLVKITEDLKRNFNEIDEYGLQAGPPFNIWQKEWQTNEVMRKLECASIVNSSCWMNYENYDKTISEHAILTIWSAVQSDALNGMHYWANSTSRRNGTHGE